MSHLAMPHLAIRKLLPILPLLLLAACTAQTPQAPRAALPPPPDPKTQMTALEDRIEALVEAERLKLDPKAKPLQLDPELMKVARARAADMAAKNYLAHAGPDGVTSATLLMDEDATFQGLLGENLAAQHYVKQTGVNVDVFARRFLDTWVKSKPHRDNLAFPQYDRTGVGAAVNGDTVYVTQLFATDLGLTTLRDPASKPAVFPSPGAAQAASRQPPVRLRGAEGVAPQQSPSR